MMTHHAVMVIKMVNTIIMLMMYNDDDDDDDNDNDNNDDDDDGDVDNDDDDENTPGPFAPPGRSRPSLKMTALSYSCTT